MVSEKNMNKYLRVIKKIIKKESVVVVHQEQEYWDKQFKKGKWRNSEEAGQNVGVVARTVLREASKRPINVLDVGCGSGVLGQYISLSPNVTYFGTDVSNEAISQAKERVSEGTFFCADMVDGLNTEIKFDIIVFAEVLLYCDYKKAVQVHQTLLKEDGFVVVSLYQTWRTRYIWSTLQKIFNVHEDVLVKDIKRKISWRVRTCEYVHTCN